MSRKPYPSDLSDLEWSMIEPLLPQPKRTLSWAQENNRTKRNSQRNLIFITRGLPMAIATPRSSSLVNSKNIFRPLEKKKSMDSVKSSFKGKTES